MSAKQYIAAGCSSDMLRRHAFHPVFVDLFCGEGSMSNQAARMGFKTVLTLDWDESCSPDFCCNILKVHDEHVFIKRMEALIAEGYIIVMHASPPCDQFSKMNTTGQKDIKKAMRIVEKSVEIMKRFSQIYTLENPMTGTLWDQPFSKSNFKIFHDVDYCAYGAIIRKTTRIVFSKKGFKRSVLPLRCPSQDQCLSCFRDPRTGRRRHTSMTELGYNERICIPPQLCVVLLSASLERAKRIANDIADKMDAMPLCKRPRPVYKNEHGGRKKPNKRGGLQCEIHTRDSEQNAVSISVAEDDMRYDTRDTLEGIEENYVGLHDEDHDFADVD